MKDNANEVKLTIDGRELSVDGSLTILEAARQNGIDIPTLCHHPALSNWGGCRLCVVQVDNAPKLVASCVTPVRNGMSVITNNETITASRRMTLEFLFAERNHNCMFCPQSGDCELQKMAYVLQMDHLTVAMSFNAFPTDVTGEYMAIDHNRCILCGRCVRACQEIAGSYVLGLHYRGPNTLIGFDLLDKRENSTCINCGACLQVCPTGAISNRYRAHYNVKGQPVKRHFIDTVCTMCGLLCPIRTEVSDNQLIKIEGIMSGIDERPDRGQLCYKGRFEVLKSHGQRLTVPMVKNAQGYWREIGWPEAIDHITDGLIQIRRQCSPDALFGIASSNLSNETLLLFKELMVDGWGTVHLDVLEGEYLRSIAASQNPPVGGLSAEASWRQIAASDMVLLVGADVQSSHPMLVSLLRRAFVEKSLSIVIIGKCDDTHLLGTHCLPVADEQLSAVLNCMAGGLMVDASPSCSITALTPDEQMQVDAISKMYAAAKAPLILAGDHLTSPQAESALKDLFVIARSKEKKNGRSAFISFLKPSSNTMASWQLGVAARAPQNQNLHGGLLLLENESDKVLPLLTVLQPALDFLSVITPYFNSALAEMSHVMLPKPLTIEEDGSYISMDGRERVYKPKVLDPPSGVTRTWEILQLLSKRIDAPGANKSWHDIQAKTEQLLAVM